jgi:hypothetical protein
VRLAGPRRQQRLEVIRTLRYHGFDLETTAEPLPGRFPPSLAEAAREALVSALTAGEVAHPDQADVRRSVQRIREYWRRSGGRIPTASDDAVRAALASQLAAIASWSQFQRTRIQLDPDAHVPPDARGALDALPSTIHLYGDATALEYDIERGEPIVRIRLREGQARRLDARDLPPFDRPVRFAVIRGGEPPLEASSLDALRALLRRSSGKVHPHRHRKHGGRGGSRSRRR